MHRALLILLSLLAAGCAPTAPLRPAAPLPSEEDALAAEMRLVLQRMADIKAGVVVDSTFSETPVGALVSNEFGAIRWASLRRPGQPDMTPALARQRQYALEVSDVRARRYGELVIVSHLLDMRLAVHEEPVRKQFRITQVLRPNPGAQPQWTVLAFQETVLSSVPTAPARVDPALYDDYAGRYLLEPETVYTVTRVGDRLMWGGGEARELYPESETTFMFATSAYRVVFVRGDDGRISHLRLREYPGVEYNAIRLP
jgi:hypothetical protein